MEDLDALWERYREAVRAGGNPQALYQEMVWPALLALWREKPRVYPFPQAFAVSVHTLGTSPEATALAILGAGAERVYVLHTPESARFLPRLRQDTGKDLYPVEIGKSDVEAIYREVKRLLEKHPEVPVALDLTSGTKAMSAGLAAAGFFFQRFYPKVRVVYVDNEDYDPELRRPRAGTEKLRILPNPHEALAEVDALFALLAEMYRAWRALDFGEALKAGRKLLGQLSQNVWLNHPLNARREALEAQVALLEAVDRFLKARDFALKEGVYGLARTLLHLAQEAKEEAAVLAALYAYRALELLLQERLALLGRRAEAPGLSPEEAEALRKALAELLGVLPEEVRLPAKLGLLDLLAFLRLKGDEALGRLSLAELRGLAGALKGRNSALLVHGFDVPSPKAVEGIARLAQGLLQDLEARTALGPLSPEPVPLGF